MLARTAAAVSMLISIRRLILMCFIDVSAPASGIQMFPRLFRHFDPSFDHVLLSRYSNETASAKCWLYN